MSVKAGTFIEFVLDPCDGKPASTRITILASEITALAAPTTGSPRAKTHTAVWLRSQQALIVEHPYKWLQAAMLDGWNIQETIGWPDDANWASKGALDAVGVGPLLRLNATLAETAL